MLHNGSASDFQSEGESSILSIRSQKVYDKVDKKENM